MSKVRIKLNSIEIAPINQVIGSIREITQRAGVVMRGPIPLPTRKLKVTTRKSPCGDGTATFDRFEMRVHRRIIDIAEPSARTVEALNRLVVPAGVFVKIKA